MKLDPNERAGLLPSSIATQGELNELELANIRVAERWALGRKKKSLLSEAFVRGLHKRMFCEVWRWAGSYRTSNKNLGVDWPQIVSEVVKLCADVNHWVEHRAYGWDELGARFHHRLVWIHPFPNGNGRHARLMTDALLKTHSQALFTWGRKNLTGSGDVRDRYIHALREADRRNLEPLVQFVRS